MVALIIGLYLIKQLIINNTVPNSIKSIRIFSLGIILVVIIYLIFNKKKIVIKDNLLTPEFYPKIEYNLDTINGIAYKQVIKSKVNRNAKCYDCPIPYLGKPTNGQYKVLMISKNA